MQTDLSLTKNASLQLSIHARKKAKEPSCYFLSAMQGFSSAGFWTITIWEI